MDRLLAMRLGYPAGHRPGERVRARVDAARDWFAAHARPWSRTASGEIQAIEGDVLHVLPDHRFRSTRLVDRCREVSATRLVVLAASAGPEVEERVDALWKDRPDEAYVLDRIAAAHVEQAVVDLRRELGQPSLSPGHPGWDLGQQGRVLGFVGEDRLRLHPSGMLEPRHSILAAIGVPA